MKEELLNNRVLMDGIVNSQSELKVCGPDPPCAHTVATARRRGRGARDDGAPLTCAPRPTRAQSQMKQYGTMSHEMKDM